MRNLYFINEGDVTEINDHETIISNLCNWRENGLYIAPDEDRALHLANLFDAGKRDYDNCNWFGDVIVAIEWSDNDEDSYEDED